MARFAKGDKNSDFKSILNLENVQIYSFQVRDTLKGNERYADKMAYINHDIEDAIRAKIIKNEDIPKKFTDVLGTSATMRYTNLIHNIIRNSSGKNDVCMSDDMQEIFTGLRAYMFEEVYTNEIAKAQEKKAEKKEVVRTGVICPVCGEGEIVERVSGRGRSKGATFYACDRYPKCKTTYSGIPTGDICPECNHMMINVNGVIRCSSEKCPTNEGLLQQNTTEK